jgi:hypothetical protein
VKRKSGRKRKAQEDILGFTAKVSYLLKVLLGPFSFKKRDIFYFIPLISCDDKKPYGRS